MREDWVFRQQCRPGRSSVPPPGGARGPGVGGLSLKTHLGLGWLFPSMEGFTRQPGSREGAHLKLGHHSSEPGTGLACCCLVGQEAASSLLGNQDTPRSGPSWDRQGLAAEGCGWSQIGPELGKGSEPFTSRGKEVSINSWTLVTH